MFAPQAAPAECEVVLHYRNYHSLFRSQSQFLRNWQVVEVGEDWLRKSDDALVNGEVTADMVTELDEQYPLPTGESWSIFVGEHLIAEDFDTYMDAETPLWDGETQEPVMVEGREVLLDLRGMPLTLQRTFGVDEAITLSVQSNDVFGVDPVQFVVVGDFAEIMQTRMGGFDNLLIDEYLATVGFQAHTQLQNAGELQESQPVPDLGEGCLEPVWSQAEAFSVMSSVGDDGYVWQAEANFHLYEGQESPWFENTLVEDAEEALSIPMVNQQVREDFSWPEGPEGYWGVNFEAQSIELDGEEEYIVLTNVDEDDTARVSEAVFNGVPEAWARQETSWGEPVLVAIAPSDIAGAQSLQAEGEGAETTVVQAQAVSLGGESFERYINALFILEDDVVEDEATPVVEVTEEVNEGGLTPTPTLSPTETPATPPSGNGGENGESGFSFGFGWIVLIGVVLFALIIGGLFWLSRRQPADDVAVTNEGDDEGDS